MEANLTIFFMVEESYHTVVTGLLTKGYQIRAVNKNNSLTFPREKNQASSSFSIELKKEFKEKTANQAISATCDLLKEIIEGNNIPYYGYILNGESKFIVDNGFFPPFIKETKQESGHPYR